MVSSEEYKKLNKKLSGLQGYDGKIISKHYYYEKVHNVIADNFNTHPKAVEAIREVFYARKALNNDKEYYISKNAIQAYFMRKFYQPQYKALSSTREKKHLRDSSKRRRQPKWVIEEVIKLLKNIDNSDYRFIIKFGQFNNDYMRMNKNAKKEA